MPDNRGNPSHRPPAASPPAARPSPGPEPASPSTPAPLTPPAPGSFATSSPAAPGGLTPDETLGNAALLERGDPLLAREIRDLKQRILQEAAFAVGMVESAVEALLHLKVDTAREVVGRDDHIDKEEVRIEEECLRILALHRPFARDFRTITTLMRINADLERVADHATSLAKLTIRLNTLGSPKYPTALQELTQRVPMLCHALLTTLLSENIDAARAIFAKDKAIDGLDKRLFEESLDLMGPDRASKAKGLILYRCGRELERVGDLMTNIAEDVMYLVTGAIVRHAEKRRIKSQTPG